MAFGLNANQQALGLNKKGGNPRSKIYSFAAWKFHKFNLFIDGSFEVYITFRQQLSPGLSWKRPTARTQPQWDRQHFFVRKKGGFLRANFVLFSQLLKNQNVFFLGLADF